MMPAFRGFLPLWFVCVIRSFSCVSEVLFLCFLRNARILRSLLAFSLSLLFCFTSQTFNVRRQRKTLIPIRPSQEPTPNPRASPLPPTPLPPLIIRIPGSLLLPFTAFDV